MAPSWGVESPRDEQQPQNSEKGKPGEAQTPAASSAGENLGP